MNRYENLLLLVDMQNDFCLIDNRSYPATQMNKSLINIFKSYKNLIIAGEVKNHCVANIVKQMLEVEGLPQKLTILWNRMSDVVGFEDFTMPIYDKAMSLGAKPDKTIHVALT